MTSVNEEDQCPECQGPVIYVEDWTVCVCCPWISHDLSGVKLQTARNAARNYHLRNQRREDNERVKRRYWIDSKKEGE